LRGDRLSEQRFQSREGFAALEPTSPSDEPSRLPAIPGGSRVDQLPQDFLQVLSRRPLLPGDVIASRYRLVETLGNGAMGQVFIGEILSIGRRVAIKVLKPELLANPIFQTRFQREAQAIASINHPNVVRFLDLVLGDPTFLVMELVQGSTLRDVLRTEHQLPPRRAVLIAERLAWALGAVHAAGIIHRDLKPSNILLSQDVELGVTPKIIDFGVVRFTAMREGLQVTRTGQVVGTLHYMAPEQISTGEVDARADLYALGAVLYHMLAGEPAFAEAIDEGQLLFRILNKPPAPLPRSEQLPSSLVSLIAGLLSKRPEDRPANAIEAARQLQRIGRDLDGLVAPVRRRSLTARALGFSALILAAGLGGGLAYRYGAHLHDPKSGSPSQSGMLVVTSRPTGAQVQLDGAILGETTPTAIRGLAAGRHRLRLSLKDHASVEQTVNLSEGQRQAVEIAMPPVSRNIEIQTQPPDAAIYLNGELSVQRTPAHLEIGGDDFYEVRLEKLGYQTVVTRITPETDATILKFSLDPELEPRGAIVVDSNTTAHVFIDGLDTGLTSPTTGILVPSGAHSIQLRSELGESVNEHVRLRQGETLRVSLNVVPKRRR